MFSRTKFLAVAFAIVLTPSLHPQVFAQKPAATPSATPARDKPEAEQKKLRPLPYQATVFSVNRSAGTFTTRTKEGKEHLFNLTAATKIEKNGAATTIDEIRAGEIVRGSRVKLGENKWEARRVIIGAKEPKEDSGKSGK